MSVLQAIRNSNKVQGLESAFNVLDVTSTEMKVAIARWFAMYFEGDSLEEEDDCLRLPVVVVNKLYKTVFSEYHVQITGKHKDFLFPLLVKLDKVKKKAMQCALAGGECFIKPIIANNTIDFRVVRRDAFIPFARDEYGRITDFGACETTVKDNRYYTLAERRRVALDGTLTIENKLFVSDSRDLLGSNVPLNTLEKYKDFKPVFVLRDIFNLGMVPLKCPQENCVDGSSDGVSVYAPAVGVIKNINHNEWLLDLEFDNGASKVIASSDMIRTDKNGKKTFSDSLFVAVDDDPESVGVTIYNPTLREASFLARKQEYLRNCETLIGLKRGILSEVEAVERTAKEITSSEGDYDLTIRDFQDMWEEMLKELLVTCIQLGKNYGLIDEKATIDPKKDIVIDWGDGVLYNRDKVWGELVGMVNSGLLKPEIAVAWYFDMPCETDEDLKKVREKYMPLIEGLEGEE